MSRTYSYNQWTSPTGNVNGVSFPILYGGTGINELVAPNITTITPGDSTMTISFTDTNTYGNRNSVYAIFGNGLTLGYATGTNLGGSNRSTQVAGFTNGIPYAMQIAAMAYSGNAQFPNIGYQQSDLSNTVNATTQWVLPTQQYNNDLNPVAPVEVIRVPSTIYPNCELVATSTFTYNGNQYTGTNLNQNMSIGLYDGVIKVKARIVQGSLDGTYNGEVDYVLKDIDVNILNAFNTIYNSNFKQIDTIYDEATEPLCPNCPDYMDNYVKSSIEELIAREYYISKEFLKKNIKSFIKNNFNEALKSRDAARRFIDILNFQAIGLSNNWKDYEIPYKGTIWINVKLIVGSEWDPYNASKRDVFNYNLIDNNNKILKTGRGVGAIVFTDLPDCSTFSFGVLRAVSSTSDLTGQ
jgi:hypothetical protein